MILFTEVEEIPESKSQTKPSVEDSLPVLFFLHVLVDVRILQCLSCSYPSDQGSVQTLSEHLLQAKWGCFLDTSVNCAVCHTQLNPRLPLRGFLKGDLKCTVFYEHERDVASNYLCAVFILVLRSLTGTQLYLSVLFFPSQTCFSEQKKTSNLEAYVKWFNRLCYLVATEICMVSYKYVPCFTPYLKHHSEILY